MVINMCTGYQIETKRLQQAKKHDTTINSELIGDRIRILMKMQVKLPILLTSDL